MGKNNLNLLSSLPNSEHQKQNDVLVSSWPGNPVSTCPIQGNRSKILCMLHGKRLFLPGNPVCLILGNKRKMMVLLLGKIILADNPVCPILDLFHGERISMPSNPVYPILGNKSKKPVCCFIQKDYHYAVIQFAQFWATEEK